MLPCLYKYLHSDNIYVQISIVLKVEYDVNGFLDKNRDALSSTMVSLMKGMDHLRLASILLVLVCMYVLIQ